MRIAIAGASGTGKTTLARAISEKYSLPLNPIGARGVALEMGFQNPYDVDAAGKRGEFQRRLFETKRDWERAHDAFVTDRTTLDNLTYSALHMADQLEDDAVTTYTRSAERYDFIVRVWKRDFQKLDDGARKTESAYHELYELLLGAIIERSRGLLVLDLGDVVAFDERLAKVSQVLDSFRRVTGR